jgi:hypothetical protein
VKNEKDPIVQLVVLEATFIEKLWVVSETLRGIEKTNVGFLPWRDMSYVKSKVP